MRKVYLFLCFFLFSTASAWAIQDRNAEGTAGQPKLSNMPMTESVNLNMVQKRFNTSPSNANSKDYSYSPDITMKLTLREFMNTTVVLPEGEGIKAVSLGDQKNFFCSPVRLKQREATNLFEVWGKYPGADTSLKVYGESGNIYVFYLRIDSVESENDPTLIAHVTDPNFPQMPKSEKTPLEETTTDKYAPQNQTNKDIPDYLPSLKDVEIKDLHFNYQVADPKSELAPIRVFDDGYFTYFQFGEKDLNQVRNLPTLYRVVDRTDQPFTNVQKQGGYVIATTVNDKWTLRSGSQYLCIRIKK